MSNAFVKGYLNSLKKREYHGGSDKLKNSTLIGARVGFKFRHMLLTKVQKLMI